MRILSIFILTLSLQGCAFLDWFRKPEPPVVPPDVVVHIDSKLLEQCEQLKTDLQLSSFDQFIIEYGNVATLYGKCASKQAASVKLIKELGNIK